MNNYYKNTVLFFDPPYVNRILANCYEHEFKLDKFINKLIQLKGENTLILYTDSENELSDSLIDYRIS